MRFFGLQVILFVFVGVSALAQSPTLNEKVSRFVSGKLGQRVGGGECAHLAMEALRHAGAKFLRGADHPEPGDYVWGKLIAVLEPGKLDFKTKVKSGDLVQFRNSTFKNGALYTHHTAVVAEVDDRGQPTAVWEENVGPLGKADRTVRKTKIDFGLLKSGWIRIYQPEPRVRKPGQYEFVLLNRTDIPRDVFVQLGDRRLFTISLTADNTDASYGYGMATINAPIPPTLVVGASRINIVDAAGYEIVTNDGKVTIRRMP